MTMDSPPNDGYVYVDQTDIDIMVKMTWIFAFIAFVYIYICVCIVYMWDYRWDVTLLIFVVEVSPFFWMSQEINHWWNYWLNYIIDSIIFYHILSWIIVFGQYPHYFVALPGQFKEIFQVEHLSEEGSIALKSDLTIRNDSCFSPYIDNTAPNRHIFFVIGVG